MLDFLSRLADTLPKPVSMRPGKAGTMDQEDVSKYLAKIGSKGGKKAAAGMTKEQRIERARKAAVARHGKKGGKR